MYSIDTSPLTFIKKPIEIKENIYLGNAIVAIECAKSNKFGLIISVITEHEFNNYFSEIKINNNQYNKKCARLEDKVNHVLYCLSDSNNSANFNDINLFKICWCIYGHLNSKIFNNKKILIHCAAGMNRSVAIIIAYLINTNTNNNYDYFYFKKLILSKRGGNIMTNPFFEKYLINYEKRIKSLKNNFT